MSWNPNDPFADITFDAPTEPGPDELLRILGGRGGAGKESFTPMANPPIDANAKKLAEEARQRVNDNSKGTGVKAYTDEKGQTVLTNTGSASMAVPDAPPNKFGGAANIATPIFDTLSKLRVEKDAPAAQALYDSLQQTIVSERTRLEQEAIRFAESKVGTTSLQNTLLAAEMADKTDPAYYPGIGDSPITAGIRTQLGQSRILAERESKSFLGANLTYNSLAKVEKEAAFEYTRVQTARDNRDSRQADRKDLIDYNKQAAADAKAAQLEETASGLSPEQVKRVQQLSEDTGDFTGNLSEDKTTAFKMIARNKDKGYQAAINAADSSLPTMALQGNNFAARIVIKEEAKRTGRSEEDVAKDMAMLKKSMLDPAFAESVFAATIKDPKELAAHKKAFRELKQSKPDEFSAKNAALAMENMKIRKDVRFVNDLDSWGSKDVDFNLAIKTAKEIAGGATFQNVLTAYTTDKDKVELDGGLLIARLKQFKTIMNESALKDEKSYFGMPDKSGPIQMIDARATGAMYRFIQKRVASLDPVDLLGTVPFMQGPAAAFAAGRSTARSVRDLLKELQTAPIDPITNKPFSAAN